MKWLEKLRRIDLFHVNLVIGVSSLARILSGLLKTKASAVLLGPAGVGLLGIMGQTQMLLLSLGSLSIGSGFLQIASQARATGDAERKQKLFGTTFSLLMGANLFFLGISAVVLPRIGPAHLGVDVSTSYLLPILISVPFGAFVVSYFQGVLFLHGRYDLWSKSNVAMAIFDLVFFVAGSWFFGIPGALWASAAGMFFLAAATVVYSVRLEGAASLFRWGFSREILRELSHFGASSGITSAATYVFGILFRIFLLHTFGAELNGAYQAAFVMSGFYTQLLTNGVWAQLFPLASRAQRDEELNSAWSESIAMMSCMAAAALSLFLVIPAVMIAFLFSRNFTIAVSFFPLVLVADYFFLVAQPSLGVMLARRELVRYTAVWCIYYLSIGVATVVACSGKNPAGIGVGYLAANLLLAAIAFWRYARSDRQGFWKALGYMLVMGLLLVGQYVLFLLLGSEPIGWILRGAFFLVTLLLAGLGMYHYRASSLRSLPLKTHMLNILRSVFMTSRVESLLTRLAPLDPEKQWLFKSLPNHYQYSKPAHREVVRRGIRYFLDIADFIDWHIYFGFSEGHKAALYDLARPGDLVIDVGANIGETALELARHVGPSGKVIAFEPDPDIRARFVKNVELNEFPNVVPEPWALSDKAATYRLFRINDRNPAGNKILESGPGDSVEVKAVTLDDYLAERGERAVNLIKIDVEGFELHVLAGARETIARQRPRMFIEVSEPNLVQQGSSGRELLALLESFGYSLWRAGDGQPISSAVPLGVPHFDVIALPDGPIGSS